MVSTDLCLVVVLGPLPSALPESEEGAFTRYLRAFEPGGEPPQEAFDAMWKALRRSVIAELRRSSAWSSPPSYLGVLGSQSWRTQNSGSGSGDEALEELLNDCYAFVFVERLARLRAPLAVGRGIDGLVVVTLRRYLQERRRRNDRLGYDIFQSLRRAARQAIDLSELWVLEGNPKIMNTTVLACSPAVGAGEIAAAEALMPIVESWCPALLPDLITARGPQRQEVVVRLSRLLVDLEAEGVHAFLFKDLVDSLKHQVRACWAAAFEGRADVEEDERGFATVVSIIRRTQRPEELLETRDFDKLVDCVAGLIEEEETGRSRRYLSAIWGFLLTWVEGPEERLPSNREAGRLLRVPRKRLPGLWKSLAQLAQRCQAALGGGRFQDVPGTEDGR